MDLRQLRYFVAIAQAGSLAKASERLRVAQPALSMQLANLEGELATRLFERHSRGVTLTASGTLLLAHAQTILGQVGEATRAIRARTADITGRVSVGFPTTMSDHFVATLLGAAERELTGVHLRVAEHSTAFLGDMLSEGTLDLAILMNAPDQASVSMQPLFLESYCLVSPPGSVDQGSDVGTINWDDAIGFPLVLASRGSILRIMLEEAAIRSGRRLLIKAELDSARLLRTAVASGYAHTIIPRSSLADAAGESRVAVRTIVNPEIRSLLQLASCTLRSPTPAQTAVRELIIRLVRDLVKSETLSAELHWSML